MPAQYGMGNGGNTAPPIIERYQINDTWDIVRIRNSFEEQTRYVLVNKLVTAKLVTAEGVAMQGLRSRADIPDPVTIELFEQLVDARNINHDIAKVIEPYIQARKEADLFKLLENDDNEPDTIESARRCYGGRLCLKTCLSLQCGKKQSWQTWRLVESMASPSLIHLHLNNSLSLSTMIRH